MEILKRYFASLAEENKKQAGAELCQAQDKLRLILFSKLVSNWYKKTGLSGWCRNSVQRGKADPSFGFLFLG